jgi:hypothetical protein
MWPFRKKPTSLTLDQLLDVAVPGVIEMSKDPNNTLHFLTIENSQLTEWQKHVEDTLKSVAELDSFLDQAISLREIVLDALDLRFNFFPFADNNRTSQEKIILAEKLLQEVEPSPDVNNKINYAIWMFAFSEANVIGTFEASKLIEGGEQANQWFKAYIDACQKVTDQLIDSLLKKSTSDPLEVMQSVLMSELVKNKQDIRKEILTVI